MFYITQKRATTLLLSSVSGAVLFLHACSGGVTSRNQNLETGKPSPAQPTQDDGSLGLFMDSGPDFGSVGALEPAGDLKTVNRELGQLSESAIFPTSAKPSSQPPVIDRSFDVRSLDNVKRSNSSPPQPQLVASTAAQNAVWVNCGPTANGNGTGKEPFNNLISARDEVRKRLKAGKLVTHLYVNVSGDCRLKGPLILTEEDSGSSVTAQVIWRGMGLLGAETASARILGSNRVQFEPSEPGSTTWSTQDPTPSSGRDLYIRRGEGFRRAIAARTPAFKFNEEYFKATGRDAEKDTTCTSAGMVSPFKPQTDISRRYIPLGSHLVVMRGYGMHRVPVEEHLHRINKEIPIPKKIMDVVCNEMDGFGRKTPPWTGWFENIFNKNFMDQPGEWALEKYQEKDKDEVKLKAHYISDTGDLRFGELAHQPNLISFRRTKYLTFTNFEMGFTTWNNNYAYQAYRHTSALVFIPSSTGTYVKKFYREPAAIELINSSNVTIRNNAFRHIGGSGIQLIAGSKDNRIEGNLMLDIGITAIEVDSRPEIMGLGNRKPVVDETGKVIDVIVAPAASNNDFIESNLIAQTGEKDWGGMGILIGFAQTLSVKNNHIYKTSYSGISSGGTLDNCWTTEDKREGPDVNKDCWNRKDIFIENNIVERAMARGSDGGAIYVNGQQPGTTVKNNVIMNMPTLNSDPLGHFVTGIYLDSGSTGMMVTSNLVPDPMKNVWFHIFDEVPFESPMTVKFKRFKLVEQHVDRNLIRISNNGIGIDKGLVGLPGPYDAWLRDVYARWRSM